LQVKDIGEFGLIRRIANALPTAPPDVVVGIGDDVAVLRTSRADYLLATCDVQVENVHFVRKAATAYQLGRKVMAVNISDIAAVGGIPAWSLVSLVIPEKTSLSFVDELYRGMADQMREAGASIVGGNISNAHMDIMIDVFLLGNVKPEHLVLRQGAQHGDAILVTGSLGDSKAGLELILHPDLVVSDSAREHLLSRHLTPEPRLQQGQILARSGRLHCMADVSDGLMSDLRHICRASRVGAELWEKDLPISDACKEAASNSNQKASSWALAGGEDYELLFTAAPDDAERIQELLEKEGGGPCRVIGKIVSKGQGIVVLGSDGGRTSFSLDFALDKGGWDHFHSIG
jgi:thiamine-monophosphate kinase